MIPAQAVEAAAKGIWEARPMERVYEEGSPDYGAAKPWGDIKQYQRDRCMTLARYALEAAAPHLMAPLVECLFRGYQTLGFDTDGDRSGAEMLSRQGLGGRDLDGFIRVMDDAFKEARADYDEACGIEPEKPNA